jgi:hypothetical protein
MLKLLSYIISDIYTHVTGPDDNPNKVINDNINNTTKYFKELLLSYLLIFYYSIIIEIEPIKIRFIEINVLQ